MRNDLGNHIFMYSDTTQDMLKPDGTQFSNEELLASIMDFDKRLDHIMSEPITTYSIKSSPNANIESAYITKENLVSYAAMLNGLFAKHNIQTNFEVKFCSMDGWMVCCDITEADATVLKLIDFDWETYDEDINEFLNDLYEFEEETEEEA